MAKRDLQSVLTEVPWTEELALRAARVNPDEVGRKAAVDRLRSAIDEERLPEGAVRALIRAGWRELES